jgi:hypothetical protein
MLNATHLFEQPARHHHNSESWWSAFFSLLLLYKAKTDPSFSLPIYTYTTAAGYRRVGDLVAKPVSFSTISVEAPLSAKAFGLAAWPVEFLGLKPDVSVLEPERRHVLFIETKTIGTSVAGNLALYDQVCAHLRQIGWSVDLCYLLSHGHEAQRDWPLIEQHALRILMWEDVLKAVINTPLARVFDVDLAGYASRPVEPVNDGTI